MSRLKEIGFSLDDLQHFTDIIKRKRQREFAIDVKPYDPRDIKGYYDLEIKYSKN